MSTLDKLRAIDESDFETLVVLYLRLLNPRLKGLIQTGINAEGKSIKCPIDAVLYSPGDDPLLVHVAATVYELEGLRRKWLGGKKGQRYEPGDIQKAEDEFAAWMQRTPGARRRLYLATNRPLENDTELYRDVVARCDASGIDVEVIEASQLVTYLDHDPEGQYLRQVFLGIDAGRLSESLLRQIAYRSLIQHQETFGISVQAESVEITRDVERRLMSVLERSPAALIGVRGVSGAGKSTLARRYGVKINDRGGVCVWVPAEDLVRHVSPAALLLRVLRRFQPSLNERAGDDALDIAAKVPGGIVLLADDMNRLNMPHEALDVARECVRADARGRPSEQGPPRVRFVMPLWPEQLAEQTVMEEWGWEVVELGFYTTQERRELAAAHADGRDGELLSLIDALNGDPFLCGLALSGYVGLAATQAADGGGLVKKIIEGELNAAAREASRTHRVVATQDEFVGALDQLIGLILRTGRPEPEWGAVRGALGERTAELLLVLGDTNRLGWVEQRAAGSRWRWKHDRLRDGLIGRWLAITLVPRLAQGGPAEEEARLLRLPGAAEAWAWALAFTAPDQRTHLAETLAVYNPLALAEALSIARFSEADAARRTVVEGLRNALEGFDPSREVFVVAPQWPVLRRISLTHDPIVLEITEHMPRNWHVCLARFRNGDTEAGLRLMKQRGAFNDFQPTSQFPALERAVEAYARARGNGRATVAAELAQAASDIDNVAAVLTLCGYLAWGELALTAWDAWSALDEAGQQAVLVPLVWAISRCADETAQDKLEAALLRARAWSDEDQVEGNIHHGSDRHWQFVEPLRFALRREMTTASTKTWARVATEQVDMRETFLHILREMDQPATVEAYVRLTSAFGGAFPDALDAQDRSGDEDRRHREQVPRAAATRERLWEMITGDEPEETRKVAFWLWKRFPTPDDVDLLRGIIEGDALFDEAFEVRLRLRDRTAALLLVKRMNAVPGRWCPFAYTLYYEEGVADALFNNLEAALNSDPVDKQYVERLPQHLPPDGIRRLVGEKRELLLRTPRMWNPLWRSDAPEAMEFLQKAIPQADKEELRYKFWSGGNSYPLTQRMLDGIAPILHYISDRGQYWLASVIVNAGRADWAETHGLERVKASFKGKVRYWLNEDDAIVILNASARAVPRGARQVRRGRYFYEIERQGNKISFDARALLRRWLGQQPVPNKLIVAAMLLASLGTGEDVEWWESVEPDEGGHAHEPWANTLYKLYRRRWQKHAGGSE